MGFITRLKSKGGADVLIRRNPLLYSRARRLLLESERLDTAARHRWRDRRLARILAAAGRTRYGASLGAPSYLGDWPLLTKEQVRAAPGTFHALPRLFTAPAATSGTTGMPLALRRSFGCVVYEQAVLDHLVAAAGIDPGACRGAVLRGDDIKSPADRRPPYWRLANGGRRLVFSSNHLDADSIGAFIEALRDYAPDVIFAYPTVLDSLCVLMAQRGDRLSVPLTVTASEVLSRQTCALAREVLGTRVLDYYGQAERVAWAHGDPEGGYRFLPSYSVNELRFAESTLEGEIYEVIGTGLWNTAMPLVRYDTGDQIRLRHGSSVAAVADGRESFLAVLGRCGDYILAPSGARLLGIDHIPRNVPHIVRTQFIQHSPASVTLLVVPAPGFNEDCRRLLLEHASLKLPPSMSIRIETTTQLVRAPSGKAPLIVRSFEQAS